MSKLIQKEIDVLLHTARYVRGNLPALEAAYHRLLTDHGIAPKGDLPTTLTDVVDLAFTLAGKTQGADLGHDADALLATDHVVRASDATDDARKVLTALRLSVRGACGLPAAQAVFGRSAMPRTLSGLLRYVERARLAVDDPSVDWKPAAGLAVDKAKVAEELDGLRATLGATRDAGKSRSLRTRDALIVRNGHAQVLHRATVALRALAESLFVLVGDTERAAALRHRHTKRNAKDVTPTPPTPALPPAPKA